MSDTDKKQGILDDIEKLRRKQDKLYAELGRSLALQKLWPGVFKHGRCTGTPVVRRDKNGREVLVSYKVRNGAGEERTFKGEDVPEVIKKNLDLEG